jgi:V-type H+-transporting ATPase subunit H
MFWKENATKLNDSNYQQLKYVSEPSTLALHTNHQGYRVLVELLKDSQDPLVLAVASHDIGQYVKHYPRGKKYTLFP